MIVPLLPPQRGCEIIHCAHAFSAKVLQPHDCAIVVVNAVAAQVLLARLPHASLWSRLHQRSASRPASCMSARVPNDSHTLMTIGLLQPAATAFQRLTLGGKLWKQIAAANPRTLVLAALGFEAQATRDILKDLLAAALAGDAPMPSFKSDLPRHAGLKSITVCNAGIDLDAIQAIDAGNHLARWWSTLPPNLLTTPVYRKAITTLARRHRWSNQFLSQKALRRLGAGAFLAVSRANTHRDAGILRLTYIPRKRAQAHVALVGKGISFDTGGINLKTHKGMYHMHGDMQGSAVAVGTLLALSNLQAPVRVDCWLALTENEIGPRAYRPQEVVTAVNGVTIQVAHSDAEGRMVLADTLALAAREKPGLIIDFATLTGACVTALMERYSAVFTNRPRLRALLERAGEASGERVWGFPMDDDYDHELESKVADVLQCTPDSKGDHILAARFLNRFVPADTAWVHVDLAAAQRSGGLAHIPTDFTGFGVRYATQLLLNHELYRNLGA